jgi:hypothetical protein
MKKVTGLGGVFFKCDNPQTMNEWYAKNLGLATSDYGTTFEWRQAEDPSKTGSTTWCTFPQNTENFNPSTKSFMINYRVENLVALVFAPKLPFTSCGLLASRDLSITSQPFQPILSKVFFTFFMSSLVLFSSHTPSLSVQ